MPRNEMKDAIQDTTTDEAECHWCMRVMQKKDMKPDSNRGVRIYICPNCQPK